MLQSNDRYIIRKGRLFLVGCPYEDSSYIRYSNSKWDAYRMTDFNKARQIAKMIDGRVMQFSLLTGMLSGGWR